MKGEDNIHVLYEKVKKNIYKFKVSCGRKEDKYNCFEFEYHRSITTDIENKEVQVTKTGHTCKEVGVHEESISGLDKITTNKDALNYNSNKHWDIAPNYHASAEVQFGQFSAPQHTLPFLSPAFPLCGNSMSPLSVKKTTLRPFYIGCGSVPTRQAESLPQRQQPHTNPVTQEGPTSSKRSRTFVMSDILS